MKPDVKKLVIILMYKHQTCRNVEGGFELLTNLMLLKKFVQIHFLRSIENLYQKNYHWSRNKKRAGGY